MAEGQSEVAAQATQDDSGVLSMEQALAALDDENWDGVKDAQAAPAPQDAAPEAAPVAKTPAPEPAPEPEKKLLAPDGELHIPYERLQKAEAEQQRLQAEAEAARQQLAQMALQQQLLLQGQAAARPEDQPAPAPAPLALPANIFGDFSDEAVAAGTQKLAQIMEQRVAEQVAAQVAARVAQEISPVMSRSEQLARNEHERAIFAAHPNADSIAQSVEFAAWVDAQPKAVARALRQTLDPERGGTAQEVIEVLDAWKAATSATSANKAAAPAEPAAPTKPPELDAKAAAQAAIDKAAAPVIASISNIPGGRPGGQDLYARLDSLEGAALSAAVEDMTPDQINKWLASSI